MFDTNARTHQPFKMTATAIACSLLVACGGGGGAGSESNSGSSASAVIQGSAVKGVISSGLVNAYLVENNAGAMSVAASPVVDGVRTGTDGSYSITLPGEFTNQTVIIEITADGSTRMKCDVPDGCGTDGQGNPIAFGELFALNNNFSLRGVATGVDSGSTFSAHISPLSHMALAYAAASQNGLTVSAIQSAFSHVEDILDLDAGIMDLAPADITGLDSIANLSKTEIEMGVVSAAFLALVNSPDWETIDEVIDHVASKMSSSGELASVNMGSLRDVTLDEVFYGANDIVDALVSNDVAGTYAAELAVVDAETASSYESVSQTDSQVTPVTIATHPQSVTVDEGDSFTLSVAASGGGSLSFQWRKNGVALSNANTSTLSVSVAELNDGGLYDVIVSNSVGSVASQSALLTVNEVISEPQIQPVAIISQPQATTVQEGEMFSFSVQATGDNATFQWRKDGQNIPGATNSSLTVSPAETGDTGYYDVVVSNSLGSVSSNTALLTVTSVPTAASVALSWDIPLQREDGSALELYDIQGYVIAYGTDSGNLTSQITVTGAAQTSTVIEDLSANTYYFAIATVDSDGVQGNYSSEISQTVM